MAKKAPRGARFAPLAAALCVLATGTAAHADLDRDPYKDWRPRFMPAPMVVGTSYHWVSTSHTGLSGNSDSTSYSFPPGVLGDSVTAVSVDLRMTLFDYGPFYAAWETQIGKAFTAQPVTLPNTTSSFDYWVLGAAVGASLPRIGATTIRLETLIGFRQLSVGMTTPADCGDPTDPGGCVATATAAVLEPRVFVDYALAPWATLSAYGGGDVIRPGALSTGVQFALQFPRELY